MDIGAILFILAILWYGLIDTSWRDKKPDSTVDVHRVDVLHGGDDGTG